MHEIHGRVERSLDAAALLASRNEQGIVEAVSSTDASKEIWRERLSVEIAVEWAHLGGD